MQTKRVTSRIYFKHTATLLGQKVQIECCLKYILVPDISSRAHAEK